VTAPRTVPHVCIPTPPVGFEAEFKASAKVRMAVYQQRMGEGRCGDCGKQLRAMTTL